MMTVLKQQFYRMTRKRDEPLEVFVDRLKDVAHRLEGSGRKVEEMDKTMVLLSSAALEDVKIMVLCTALQARWSPARTPEEATKLLSFDSAVAQLVNGAKQAYNEEKVKDEFKRELNLSSAFFTCWGCQKPGHRKDQCPNLKEIDKTKKNASEQAFGVRVKEQQTRDQIQGLGTTYHFQN